MNGVIDQALAYLAQPPIKTQTGALTETDHIYAWAVWKKNK